MEENRVLLIEIAEGLNPISWRILDYLNKYESSIFKDIKENIEVGVNKASKELARLEGATLIVSERDTIDTRSLNYRLTENGIKILKYKNIRK